jgi:hypothetical protein
MIMSIFKIKLGLYPAGIWLALIALALISLAWIMQAYSLLNWEKAVELGLQNNGFFGDEIERVKANKERGEAIADLLWPLPLTVLAFIGLFRTKFYGFIAAMMEFAICIYFPLFYVFQLWNSNRTTAVAAVILWSIPSVLGILGLWSNRNLFNTAS